MTTPAQPRRIQRLLDEIAADAIPTDRDLWPEIRRRVHTASRPPIAARRRIEQDADRPATASDTVLPGTGALPGETPRRRTTAWLQFAGGSLAIVLVGLLVVAVFSTLSGGGGDAPGIGNDAPERFELIVSWNPDGTAGLEKLYVVPLDGTEPRRLVPDATGAVTREVSPDVAPDGRVVFASVRDGQSDLYVWDGRQLQRLTNTDWTEHEPRWSPDGTRIAFIGPSANRDIAQIWVINADGSGLEQVTDRHGGAVSPAWSPDSSRIAFTSIGEQVPSGNGWTANTQLWIMNADGSDQRQITKIDSAVATFSWLDDDQLVAVGRQATIVGTDGTVVRELAADRRLIGDAPASLSGHEVAIVSPSGADDIRHATLLIATADGAEVREIAQHDQILWSVAWSPDGEQLAYTRGDWPTFTQGPPPDPAADWTLAVIDRDGGDERVLLDGVNRGHRIVWRRVAPEQQVVVPEQAVRNALEPVPVGQEQRLVMEVEAHNGTDNAFERWTVDRWQRWTETGRPDLGMYVAVHDGEIVSHVVRTGNPGVMQAEPNAFQGYDVPLEFSLQERILHYTLTAMNDPETHNLQREERDGWTVLTYEWQDHYGVEFDYISHGEAWIDPATGRLDRIVHLIDRPDQDPYPARTFTIRVSEVVPAGMSPDGTYEIGGGGRS